MARFETPNSNYPVGFGYITIPVNIDRDKYIETCYRRERVAIQLDEGGSQINNCFISKEALGSIQFPVSANELGSGVVFIVPEFKTIPVIIGVVSKLDETQLLKENSFKKVIKSKNSIVSIEGDGNTGELFINVTSDDSEGGNINIFLRNNDKSSKFDLKCFGNIDILAEGDITIKNTGSLNLSNVSSDSDGNEVINSNFNINNEGFSLSDKYTNRITSDENGIIKVYPKERFEVFEGSEPSVKGKELKSQLETMKDRIDRIIMALEAGSAASASAATYSAAVMLVLNTILTKEDFNKINSSKVFID